MIKDLDYLFKRLDDISKAVNCLKKCLQTIQTEQEKVEPKEIKELKKRLKKHEGLKLSPYRCPTGHLTIGYGHNLEAKGITPDVAEILLEKDMQDAFYDLKQLPEESWKHLSLRRQCVLVEMIFNMGVTKVLKFKHMLKALAEKDYKRAAEEMLDSRWAEQVGERAKTLAKIMEEG
ncbi:MAG: glycoside hydrolase family protein [Candidatus Desulfofervidaceae bacterium]|nr:glycoside hydrolase family protein [Candidatus Desulfofervidaceae bacterium]